MLVNRIFFTPDEECTDDASDEGVNVSPSARHSCQGALDQLVYEDEQSKVAAMLPRELDCLLQFGEGVQGLLQLTTMEEVKEGGKVEEEEEGGCRVPCGVALTSIP